METLYEIIENVKDNKRPDYEELRYALLVLDFMFNMDHSNLRKELLSDKKDPEFIREIKAQNSFDMAKGALNKPPKDYLGWDNDPENPEYQKRREMSNKIFNNFLTQRKKGD